MIPIACGLITCDRFDYTTRTVSSLVEHGGPRSHWVGWYHGDDASQDPRVVPAVQAAGFETVLQHPHRRGARAIRRALIGAAQQAGAEWLLLLENDWTFVRPFPWTLLTHLVETQPAMYTLRLYGQHKGANGTYPCVRRHLGQPGRPPVTWTRIDGAPEPVEAAAIHWGAPPSVTRIAELLTLHAEPSRGRDDFTDEAEIRASGRLAGLTVRPIDNVVVHIGEQRTAAAPRAPRVARYTPAWQTRRAWIRPHARACFDLAVTQLGVPASLLDVGCGDGALVQHTRRTLGAEAIGVDLSLPEGAGTLRFADLREPLDLGRTFDWILCWEVAEHLPESAADTLVGSLVRHLAPGGRLLFTAAVPGQGGDGHLHEAPRQYWRDKLTAAGLAYQDTISRTLGRRWLAAAPQTKWYGNNLQVFTAPAPAEAVWPERLALTIRTADRTPGPNYVGGTVRRLLAQGVPPARIHLCATAPDVAWLRTELAGVPPVTLHVPAERLTPNRNGLAQIACLGDLSAYDWVLLLEDDLVFCADFGLSVWRWLQCAARADRHVYRFFGFRLRPPTGAFAYDWPLRGLCGSQAVALRSADAADFLAWATANLETWGGFRGNAAIAFDKLIASWALARWPGQPGVVSHPLFVKHIGLTSSIHARAIGNDALFAGEDWRYTGAAA
jgi:SAM-dependent methyltransferase